MLVECGGVHKCLAWCSSLPHSFALSVTGCFPALPLSPLWRGHLVYRCQAYFCSCRGCLAAYVIQRHRNAEMLDWQSRLHYAHLPKKRCTQAFSVPQRRPKRTWLGMPKLSQTTIFTIITNAMRRPLLARGVGDLGPAKAESPTLFCFPQSVPLLSQLLCYILKHSSRVVQLYLKLSFPTLYSQSSQHSRLW
jgi:hypothetical protein